MVLCFSVWASPLNWQGEGPQVELVVVADDCALEAKGITGRRGIAGTVFVHKVPAPALKNTQQRDGLTCACTSAEAVIWRPPGKSQLAYETAMPRERAILDAHEHPPMHCGWASVQGGRRSGGGRAAAS